MQPKHYVQQAIFAQFINMVKTLCAKSNTYKIHQYINALQKLFEKRHQYSQSIMYIEQYLHNSSIWSKHYVRRVLFTKSINTINALCTASNICTVSQYDQSIMYSEQCLQKSIKTKHYVHQVILSKSINTDKAC
jgi:hypothetical protein